ncbi:MAG TPA: glycosyltransferase [Puia sp.]
MNASTEEYPGSAAKGIDIVVIGLAPWYMDIGATCKSIAEEFSRFHRVLYVNMPLDRKTILGEKNDPNIRKHLDIIRNKKEDITEVKPNLWVYYPRRILESINWIPSTALFSVFNRVNNRRFAMDIKEAAERMGFKDYIVFNDNDIFRPFYLKEILHPKLYIYLSRDNIVGVDYWKRHGLTLEPKHIAKADIAVANSHYLEKYLRSYNPNTYFIETGCDLSLFDPAKGYARPADMKDLSGPVIGYMGALNSLRIDESIIKQIARSRPDWNVVLVGPEDDFFSKSELHQYPNVHFLGKKPMSQLPAYAAHFDVCINPQLVNIITIGNYPLKVDEYLAMGKPVVATHTDAMLLFGDMVYLADKPEDYPALIEKALKADNDILRKDRFAMAKAHTWENTVKKIHKAITKTLSL